MNHGMKKSINFYQSFSLDNTENLYISRQNVATNSIYGESDDLDPNEFIELETPALGQLSLVRKKTPYVDNPSDMMIRMKDSDYSQITEMPSEKGGALLELCSQILDISAEEISGRKFIAINQQLECTDIPDKYASDGTELKVQTINEIHPHMFILQPDYPNTWQIGELDDEDYHDFYDEFAVAVSEALSKSFQTGSSSIRKTFNRKVYPIGLIFKVSINGSNEFHQTFDLMQRFQNEYSNLYYQYRGLILDDHGNLLPRRKRLEGMKERVRGLNLSKESEHSLLKMFVASIPRDQEVRKYLRFIQGPALTWLMEISNTELIVHPSLRFISRGNAMESLGVWVDQGYDRQDTYLNDQKKLYQKLMRKMHQYNAKKGNIYKFIDNENVIQ
jgi:hypothetical protein